MPFKSCGLQSNSKIIVLKVFFKKEINGFSKGGDQNLHATTYYISGVKAYLQNKCCNCYHTYNKMLILETSLLLMHVALHRIIQAKTSGTVKMVLCSRTQKAVPRNQKSIFLKWVN